MTSRKIPANREIEFSPDAAFSIHHRFKNLENPLKFIENESIVSLQRNYDDLKETLKRKQEEKAEFSKSIYKKIISRDN
jgi:hypothetical protein